MIDSLETIRRIAQHDRQLERLETLPAGGGGGVGAHNAAIPFVFNRGGGVLALGMSIELRVHFAGTVVRWTVGSNLSGNIRFNIAKCTHAAYIAFSNIDGTDPPALSAALKAESTSLTGWTTSIVAGDWLRCEVDSAVTPTVMTRATVILEVEPS